MPYKEITAAASEPINKSQIKVWLKIADAVTTEDDLLDWLIESARRHCEIYMRRQILSATWELQLDEFPTGSDPIEINWNKVTSITSIKYFDADNVEQTWTSTLYENDLESEPARVRPISTESYPATYDKLNNVKVRFVTGYTNVAAVPKGIIQAMQLYIAHWYENREAVVIGRQVNELPIGAQALLDQYRNYEFK